MTKQICVQAQLRRAASPVLRALAAAITLGSGASLGPEGPSVDIGRSSARALGSLLRSKHRRLFPLIAAGSGAGTHHSLMVLDTLHATCIDFNKLKCCIALARYVETVQ